MYLYPFVIILPLIGAHRAPLAPLMTMPHSPSIASPVFLLGPSKPGTASLRTALHTLGYSPTMFADSPPANFSAAPSIANFDHSDDKSVVELGCRQSYAELAVRYPSAKFILTLDEVTLRFLDGTTLGSNSLRPKDDALENSCQDANQDRTYVLSLRAFFSRFDQENRVLEIVIDDELEADDGERWVRLCRFLGLGYSIVERKRLKTFPKDTRRVLWQN